MVQRPYTVTVEGPNGGPLTFEDKVRAIRRLVEYYRRHLADKDAAIAADGDREFAEAAQRRERDFQ